MASGINIQIPQGQLADFCQRWKVKELALFDSAPRDDFRPDRGTGLLVQFYPDARWSLFDVVTMQDELGQIFGRKVDVVEREGLRNPFRRQSILSNLEIIYETSGS